MPRILAPQNILLVLTLSLAPFSSASAYVIGSPIYYNSDFYFVAGSAETWEDWWDGEYYSYDPFCECDIYVSGWVEVEGRLSRPNGEIVAANWTSGDDVAILFADPFRPPNDGNWRLRGDHYAGHDYYDQSGYYCGFGGDWCWYTGDFNYLGQTNGYANVWCTVPVNETVSFRGWDQNWQTLAEFRQELTFSSPFGGTNFGGRVVTEQTLAPGNDSCYFDGSTYPPQTTLTGSNWTVAGDNTWEPDQIGWNPVVVIYYQQERAAQNLPMPCESRIPQRMIISCGGYPQPFYKDHSNAALIDFTQIAGEKAGQRIWKNFQ